MSGLVLSLRANEKFLVNGALLINGSKRSQIRIGDENVNVLRLSDALHPNEITTPVRRVYYAAQIFLSCDANTENIADDIQNGLNALETVFTGTPLAAQIAKSKKAAASGRFYSLLCALRPLLMLESELLKVDLPSICRPSSDSHVNAKPARSYAAIEAAVINAARAEKTASGRVGYPVMKTAS